MEMLDEEEEMELEAIETDVSMVVSGRVLGSTPESFSFELEEVLLSEVEDFWIDYFPAIGFLTLIICIFSFFFCIIFFFYSVILYVSQKYAKAKKSWSIMIIKLLLSILRFFVCYIQYNYFFIEISV